VKIRAKLAKRDPVKFISHLDLMNTLTRALRRAKIPIGFSQGYNPRPLISFGSALAVGITSSSEYIDFELKEKYRVAKFKQELNLELPIGIKVLEVEEIPQQTKSLMAQINAAEYKIKLQLKEEVKQEEIEKMLQDFMEEEEIIVVRKRRNKSDRKFNLRPMVFKLGLSDVKDESILIRTLIQTGSSGNLRPEELVKALKERYPISEEFNLTNVHRLGMYVKRKEELLTPFEVALE